MQAAISPSLGQEGREGVFAKVWTFVDYFMFIVHVWT